MIRIEEVFLTERGAESGFHHVGHGLQQTAIGWPFLLMRLFAQFRGFLENKFLVDGVWQVDKNGIGDVREMCEGRFDFQAIFMDICKEFRLKLISKLRFLKKKNTNTCNVCIS